MHGPRSDRPSWRRKQSAICTDGCIVSEVLRLSGERGQAQGLLLESGLRRQAQIGTRKIKHGYLGVQRPLPADPAQYGVIAMLVGWSPTLMAGPA